MQDDGERIDLTSVALGSDADLDRFIGRVRVAAQPAMVRRQVALGVWGFLARWRRPIGAIATAIVAASALIGLVAPHEPAAVTLAEAAGVPRAWVVWTRGAAAPTPDVLMHLDLDQP